MSVKIRGILVLSVIVLAAGCGGGGDGGDDAQVVISAENTVEYGQEATNSLNGMANAGEALNEVMGQFMAMTGGAETGASRKPSLAATEETVECAGGGSVTIDVSDDSATTQTARFVANECVDDTGAMLHGELLVTISQWEEFSGSDVPAFEMTFETGSAGMASDVCEFNGGLVMRLYAEESADPYGENRFVFEYGSTDKGFISFCKPDQEINIAANTLVRNELSFSQSEDGSFTSSNTVSMEGGFEAPDGSGYVSLVATDLEYSVSEDGTSSYGAATSCPDSGHITITGADGSTASVYFGDDAPAGYAVQVIGPDGFVAEYETCEAFLAAE